MKITKSQLKQIIKEEIETDKALLDAIDKLANNIEDLDISIDFLAGAVTGETPVSLGAMSKGMGRAYMPRKGVPSKEFEAPKKEQINEIAPAAVIAAVAQWGPAIMQLVELIKENPEIVDAIKGLTGMEKPGEGAPVAGTTEL